MQQHQSQLNLSAPITKIQVLEAFEKYGYGSKSMVNNQKMVEILNLEHQQRKGTLLHKQLLQQIWSQAETTSKGEISVNTIADIVVDAQNILANRIWLLKGDKGQIKATQALIVEMQRAVKEQMDYNSDDRTKTNNMTKQLINLQIKQKQNQYDLNAFTADYQALVGTFSNANPAFASYPQTQSLYEYANVNAASNINPKMASQNFSPNMLMVPTYSQNIQPNMAQFPFLSHSQAPFQNRTKSNRLLMLFYLTLLLISVQALIMRGLRLSMVPMTAYLHSFFTLVVGLYEENSILYLICHIGFSLLGDITFMVLTIIDKYEIMPIMHSQNRPYCIILFILFIGTIFARIFMIVFYVPFKNAYYKDKIINYFTFSKHDFNLQPFNLPLPTDPYYDKNSYKVQYPVNVPRPVQVPIPNTVNHAMVGSYYDKPESPPNYLLNLMKKDSNPQINNADPSNANKNINRMTSDEMRINGQGGWH